MTLRDNAGYQYVTLYNNSGKGKDFSVHYLVATLYIANPNNLPMVNHKNHNRNDNTVENLEWVTYSENMVHFGKKNGKSVIKLDKDNNIIEIYTTIKEASEKNGITPSNITNVCNGKQKTAGGFKWKYNEEKELANPVQRVTHSNCGKLLKILIPNFNGNIKVALANNWRYGKNLKYIWTIRSQAPKSQLSRDMEKVQRLNVCGRKKIDNFQ